MTQKYDYTVPAEIRLQVIVEALRCMMMEAAEAGREVPCYFEQDKDCDNG